MKKYLFVDTWNGQGYSESKAFVLEFPSRELAILKAHELANDCANSTDDEKEPLTFFTAEDFNEEADATLFGYSYELGDDAGAMSVIDFNEETVGVILNPCINDFYVFDDAEEWQSQIDLIKEHSIDYSKEEDNVFGWVHHEDVGIPSDMLLFSKEMIIN